MDPVQFQKAVNRLVNEKVLETYSGKEKREAKKYLELLNKYGDATISNGLNLYKRRIG